MSKCTCPLVHERRRIVLTGGPGAGKTVVLEVIAGGSSPCALRCALHVLGGALPARQPAHGGRVTLFGEGVLGGTVTLQGNVMMSGSDSRIRGARITGNLSIPASGTGLSFSHVDGMTTAVGSDATLLASSLCGGAAITGSGSLVVGNTGVAPTPSCP